MIIVPTLVQTWSKNWKTMNYLTFSLKLSILNIFYPLSGGKHTQFTSVTLQLKYTPLYILSLVQLGKLGTTLQIKCVRPERCFHMKKCFCLPNIVFVNIQILIKYQTIPYYGFNHIDIFLVIDVVRNFLHINPQNLKGCKV